MPGLVPADLFLSNFTKELFCLARDIRHAAVPAVGASKSCGCLGLGGQTLYGNARSIHTSGHRAFDRKREK